jgi:hypothetical protein
MSIHNDTLYTTDDVCEEGRFQSLLAAWHFQTEDYLSSSETGVNSGNNWLKQALI